MQRITIANEVLLPQLEAMVAEGATVTLRGKGNSMLPFIVGGRDSVVLQKAGIVLRQGDIVLAKLADGRYVLHRIIALRGNQVILMGDGNLQGTEQCERPDIAAQAVKIIRNGRYVDCDSRSERGKAGLWRRLRPIRRYLLAIYRRMEMKRQRDQSASNRGGSIN